jgi:hypothetical protein
MASQTSSLDAPPTQMLDLHNLQSTNPKSNQQLEGKKKQLNKKGKGDKKDTKNVGGGKRKKRKSNYLCKLCTKDHPTHMCSRFVES